MTRSFTVVINTFNRGASLRRTLEGLQHLEHPCFEVVVVNGPSTDETAAVLAEWAGRIKVVETPERNLSVSRNLGIAAAAGEVVAFIDDDAYPDPAWLDHLDGAYDDPEVAAAGGPVLDHTGGTWQARYSLANRRGDAWVSDGPNPTDLFGSPFSDVFVYPIGTNSSFRRDALVAIGGFDEEYEFYLDETDVAVRLVDQGWLIAALDDGVVYHKFLPSEIRTERRAIRHRYSVVKNRLYFALRHSQRERNVAELLEDMGRFIDHHRRDYAWNIEQGLLEPEDLARFEVDAHRAMDLAVARGLSGEPRTRPPAWFDARPRPFLAFPVLQPAVRRLRLALLSQEYPPGAVNGIGRFVHVLATELGSRGHEVHVVTRGEGHDRVDLEEHVWVHRVAVAPAAVPDDLDLPEHIWSYAKAAADEVNAIDRRRSLDVVQFPNWDVEGIALALDGDFTTVLSLHTPLRKVVELDASVPADDPVVRALGAAERDLYGRVSAYLANGPSVVKEIERCYGVRLPRGAVVEVPHGMPPARAVTPEPATAGLDVLFVGRLEHRKGIDTLLDAVEAVLAAAPDTTFTIVGDGSIPAPGGLTYQARFEAAAAGTPAARAVRFVGRLDDDELDRRYAACDLFVAPSRYESFGLVLLEAMRHAKPVIAADIGGMQGIVDGNGLLVPPGDSAALTTAIVELLGDDERRAELGRRSLALFDERYSAAQMATGVERLYLQLLEGNETGAMAARHAGTRRLGIDLGDRLRCPDCGGEVQVEATVVTADGLCKQGTVSCRRCALRVATIRDFVYDFHDRAALGTDPEGPAGTGESPLVVAELGERRMDAVELAELAPAGWFHHDRFVLADGPRAGLVADLRCTDAAVRLLHHRWSGIVELVVDGRVVDEVDLYIADGALVESHPVIVDQPFGRHTLEIRPTGTRNPAADGAQVLVEEVVLLGPRRRGLGFQHPVPLNRGNPDSPHIARYLDKLAEDAWILECGGGDRRARRPHHVNFEYLRFELADVLGDIHHLPFADDAFDFVFSQAVFEHVRNPFEAARELIRVTRPGGLIATEVAFLQPLHAVPFHYFNMTQWGAEELFDGCEIVESDWFGALSQTVDWFLRSANLDANAPPAKVAAARQKVAELDRYISHADLRSVASAVVVVARKPPAAQP